MSGYIQTHCYGINFGLAPVEACPVKFRRSLPGGWVLDGIANGDEEKDAMKLIADNGRREIFIGTEKDNHIPIYTRYVG